MASNPTTLFDFYTDQNFVNSTDKFNCVQTAILRYYLTAQTGKRLKNERFDQKAITKQIEKLKRVKVDSSFELKSHLEVIKRGGEMYGKTKAQMKSHVSYGKRFFEFVSKSIVPEDPQHSEGNKNAILRVKEAIMDKSEFVLDPKTRGKKIILEKKPELYLPELKKKFKNESDRSLYKRSEDSLNQIFDYIDSFIEYKRKESRPTTGKNDKENILRFLGWYKKHYNLTIEEISIKNIFPIISPYTYLEGCDFSNMSEKKLTEIAIKKLYLEQGIKAKSKEFRKIINIYLHNYHHKLALSTKKTRLQSLINFTYFLYKDITDIEENDDFQDISLIKTLRVCSRDIDKIKQIKEEKPIPFTWSEIEDVCERLRKEATQNYEYDGRKKSKRGGKLTKRQKAIHLQKFLAIAFFCVMPPDRQRTFWELAFGETLKYGIRDKERNTFTPYNELKPKEEPKYYIHLKPHQYKTGNTYGTYWHEIENITYEDGSQFYDYLNQWLFEGYRDELATARKTNAIFIRTREGIGFRDDSGRDEYIPSIFSEYIRKIFSCKTKFPLRPHALRKIYVTHINNLNLDESTKKAIAYMMHHKFSTANKDYNKQSSDEKMKLGVEFLKQQQKCS